MAWHDDWSIGIVLDVLAVVRNTRPIVLRTNGIVLVRLLIVVIRTIVTPLIRRSWRTIVYIGRVTSCITMVHRIPGVGCFVGASLQNHCHCCQED
jgi:hypothetical protein